MELGGRSNILPPYSVFCSDNRREVKTLEEKKEKSVLDIITEYAVNERLDAILFRDQDFQELERKIGKEIDAFSRLGLSKKKRRTVDRLVSAHVESAAYYSGAAYRQGFKDCASLFKETGIVA